MGCQIGNDLIWSWPYLKYFVDFYTQCVIGKPKSVTQVKITHRGPILLIYF